MIVVGKVKEIWRYPVKSMAGEKLTNAQVTQTGLIGDRGWAMRNDAVKEIQGAKKFPKLMACSARYRSEPSPGKIPHVEITFPDGSTLASDSEELPARLAELTGGKPASLWPLQPPTDLEFYRRRNMNEQEFTAEIAEIFAREPGEPFPDMDQFPKEIMEFTSFPGMFFDVTPLHLLTTASLTYLRNKHPGSDWDVRRFRPNLLIEVKDGGSGLVESDWVAHTLHIGGVIIQCAGPTPRCGMTTREQPGLPFDKAILRAIVKEADQNLGVYGVVTQPGMVHVGDSAELL